MSVITKVGSKANTLLILLITVIFCIIMFSEYAFAAGGLSGTPIRAPGAPIGGGIGGGTSAPSAPGSSGEGTEIGSTAVCGNSIREGTEECDFGGENEWCTATCFWKNTTISGIQICSGSSIICGVEDGICPEDFYDPIREEQISCAGVRDIDCVRGSISVLLQGNNSYFVEDYGNDQGNVNLVSQTLQSGNYIATFTVEGPSSPSSTTTIRFSGFMTSPPAFVLFDNRALLQCNISAEPCFSFNGGTQTLTVHHSLSVHMIQVVFKQQAQALLPYFLLVFVLCLLPVIIVATKRHQYLQDLEMYKEQLVSQVQIPHNQLDKLHTYIKKKMEQGLPREKVRQSLLSVGWEPHVVDLVMHQHHAPHEDVGRLLIYVDKMRRNNHTDQQIQDLLLSRGWKKETVQRVLKKPEATK